MKFGLNKSTGLLGMENGDSPFTRNMIYSKNNNVEGISNEEGFQYNFNIGKKVIGVITTNDNTTVFFSGEAGTASKPEIGILRNGVYTILIKDDVLAFFNPIEGEYYYNNKGELVVAWWDGVYSNSNTPKVLNLDCLPFPVNIDGTLVNPADIELLSIAPKHSVANFRVVGINDGGGQLKTGSYFFTFAQQYEDSTIGNFQNVSNAVFLNKDISTVYNNYNGDSGNISTSKSITIRIENISSYIDKVTLGILKKINGIMTAITIPDIVVNSGVVEYTYTGFIEFDASLEDILVPSASIIKAQAGAQLEGRLYLGNIEQPDTPEIQAYLNNVKVNWVFEDALFLSEKAGSLKDMTFIVNSRQFKSNEVYALYLIAHYHTGERIAYHLPGREFTTIDFEDEEGNIFNTDENALISSIIAQHPSSESMQQALAINSNARLHEIFNTAVGDGTMGYWENQGEFYPDADCSDIKDGLGIVIGTLRNQKVRHHKMPSFSLLKESLSDVVTGTELDDLVFLRVLIDSPDMNFGANYTVDFIDVSAGFGVLDTADANDMKFTFFRDCNIRLKYHLDTFGVQVAGVAYVNIELETNGTRRILHGNEFLTDGDATDFTRYVNVKAKKGDTLHFVLTADGGNIDAASYIEFQDWDLVRYNAQSKLLGIVLSDIAIPVNEIEKIANFELGFAKRTVESSTIVSVAPASPSSDRLRFRMHPPDIFTFRTSINYDYMETQLAYKVKDGVSNLANEEKSYCIRKTFDSQYIPAYSTSIVNNQEREEIVYSSVDTAIPLPAGFVAAESFVYADLKKYKTQVYFDFQQQEVIPTGALVAVNDLVSSNLYGGDTFLSIIGWYELDIVTTAQETTSEYNHWLIPLKETITEKRYKVLATAFPCETVANFGYMTNNDTTKYALAVTDMTKNAVYENGAGQLKLVTQFSQSDNQWSYNSDYHALVDFLEIPIKQCRANSTDIIKKFPYRVYRTNIVNKDSDDLNWKIIKSGDYYELPKNKGVIWVIRSMGRSLCINTLYSLFITGVRDKLETNNVEIYLGDGDIFDRPPTEVVDVQNGYGGCQSKFAAFVCKAGYVYADMNQGKWFLFNGKLQELTDEKTRNYFRDTLKAGIVNEQDNPFFGSGLTGAWDEKHNRLLFGKINRLGEGGYPSAIFTFSFSFVNNAWVSEHDYYPSIMYFNRNGLYSVDNGYAATQGKVYTHNFTNLCTYYDSVVKTAYIDVVITPDQMNKIWHSIQWSSYSRKNNILDNTKTVTAIAVYNDHQCSGRVELNALKTLGFQAINTRNDIQYWSFNELDDLVINQNNLIQFGNGEFATGNLNVNKAWFNKSEFRSKMLVVRFYIDNTDQRSVTLIDVAATNTQIS